MGNVGNLVFIIFIAFFVWFLNPDTCNAREGKLLLQRKVTKPIISETKSGFGHVGSRHNRGGAGRLMRESDTAQADQPGGTVAAENDGKSAIFSVLDYGARGNGNTDDTKAFEAAWADACKVAASTMLVPSGSVFLVKPVSFSGPDCESNIVFQLDGKIMAPTSSEAWGSGLLQWLEFTKLKGITIRGSGIIDGQGSIWWNKSPATNELESASSSEKESNSSSSTEMNNEDAVKMPSTKPTALRFYGSSDVTVTGITIQSSPQTHLKFDDCVTVQVSGVHVSSPGDSPNTDGIHLQNSQDVVIRNTNIACGDDCISIQTGCSGVFIHSVNCGPGHGVSIGGLGRDNTKACVSNITVSDTTMHDTLTGVRIKTWQGGSGSVQGIMFSNIQVSEVKIPIMIDQFYCDGNKCQNETSAVAVSGISYQNIKGTYTETPVHFACSDSLPCTGVTLNTIELEALELQSKNLNEPFCWQTYGELKTTTTPPIDCLKMGKSSSKSFQC
ncbi:Polygalacturonase [Actinidia chinensis var. chinensis]|uniref:Polygalacturonase n=1 Tax=Actinidia chinensis var. chinensis TaxID=1590841 RepID=A0A2R6RZ16_ACTCC|nr:Polygalacturonase [Actinidia chinensis var. chinensis]